MPARKNRLSMRPRCFRIIEAPGAVLLSISRGIPLRLLGTNPMVELSTTVVSPGGMTASSCGRILRVPETGLEFQTGDIESVHGIPLGGDGAFGLRLEFAIRGNPSGLTAFVAREAWRDLADVLEGFRREPVHSGAYQKWKRAFTCLPRLCPCCRTKATERRRDPSRGPVAEILTKAAADSLPLRCTLSPAACGLTTWVHPGGICFAGRRITLFGTEPGSLLKLDPGIFHSVKAGRVRMDSGRRSVLWLMDSMGFVQMEISTPGWRAWKFWTRACATAGSRAPGGHVPSSGPSA